MQRTEVGDERQLVAASLRGDAWAFSTLARQNSGRVTAVVTRMLGSRDEAEDVVQEALLRAFLGVSRLRDPERFGSWLCGIAVNLAKMRLRSLRLELRLAGAAAPEPYDPVEARELLELVRNAVALLPDGQREVVLMHYVDDLSCDEIAAVLGRSPGAVRVRLHRARAQLREELAALAPASMSRPKEKLMIVEMKVEDVLVRVAADDPLRAVSDLRIVLLGERDGERLLPIWIGPAEGNALAFELLDEAPQRPLTSDLMAELLRATGAAIDRVVVTALRDRVFYGAIVVAGQELDARPSDAVNLAVRVGAPIYVAGDVLATAAISADDLGKRLDRETEEAGLELPPGEWRSLSAGLLRVLHTPPGR